MDRYRFMMKSVNDYGLSDENPATFQLYIKKPFLADMVVHSYKHCPDLRNSGSYCKAEGERTEKDTGIP